MNRFRALRIGIIDHETAREETVSPSMTRITENASHEPLQYMALAVLSLGAAGATGILSLSYSTIFQPYFGNMHPLLALAVITLVGVVSLSFLRVRGWFEIYTRRHSLRGVVLAATLATLFALVVIVVDRSIGFPRDLNVPLPQSLLFYPAMAYVVESALHAFPLALFLVVLGPLFQHRNPTSLVWLGMLLVSLLEPILPMGLGTSAQPFSWLAVYVGLHVFAFNLVQMYVFRRYDFVAMSALRLVYYLHWHIVWGYVRLQVLF